MEEYLILLLLLQKPLDIWGKALLRYIMRLKEALLSEPLELCALLHNKLALLIKTQT